MPTPIEVERQIDLERKQIRGGLEKLRKDTKNLEEKTYASATVYGSVAISEIMIDLIDYIDKKKKKYREQGCGKDMRLHGKYTLPIDTDIQALLIAKVTFDHVFSPRKVNHNVSTISIAAGHAIEGEAQLTYYESHGPELLDTLKKNYWHDAKGTEYKRKCIQTLMHKRDITPWCAWDKDTKMKVGLWLLDCLIESTGWFEKLYIFKGNRQVLTLIPTETFLKHQDEIVKCAELYSPLQKPMLIPPRDWSTLQDGGYFLNDLTRCYEMVRRGYGGVIQGEIPIAFLNKIQQVKYKVNPFIVNVAKELEERGIAVGKFRPVIDHVIPPKPADIDTNDIARKAWKVEARTARNNQANEARKSCRTRMTMNIVREFEGKAFYIPWSFDYRGRTYPIPAFLTPQCTDFGKSLLNFSEGGEVNEEAMTWLAFQVATTYGLDKASMSERLAWVAKRENILLITRVATDPIGNISDWEVADEPWQFLAACEEYYAVVLAVSRLHTHLPVATDATCSGLQILAGMARDKSTAKMVNVLDSDKPQDAYKVIAEQSLPDIPDRLKPYWDRKATKRCVMTIPYNAKPFSNRLYIREALKEKEIQIDKDELTQCVKAVRSAMNVIVPGPMKVMKWIEKEVATAIKNGAKIIKWETPSGFIVVQHLMKHETKTIKTQLMGRCEINIQGVEKGVDLSHHKNATSPNLIHSYDASLLHLAITKFDKPIALIHDSVLCRANDMSILSTLVRETYFHLFAKHEPLKSFAREIKAENEPPIIGDLEPEAVINSTYFFC
mgnify:FL=1|tara:strand:- start:1190 stop:3529 length:2340 start_codon:yes stop_codon:yes gene_type:complete